MDIKITDEILERSLINKGDTSRIKKMIQKAESGQDITVAFLGGSITQGCNSTVYEKCYVELVYGWFKEKFKNVKVEHINAGVGATGSLIGVHRVEKQVLDLNPDIVFVDFAVNDEKDYFYKVAYESLIRKILSSKSKPAVVEIFMIIEGGINMQEQQIAIGKNYDVPMISYRDVTFDMLTKNEVKWEEISTDEVHPNDVGHKLLSNLIINYIESVITDCKKDENIIIDESTLSKKCVFGDRYINGKILDYDTIKTEKNVGFEKDEKGFQVFQNNWKFVGTKDATAILVTEVEGKNISLLYKKSVSETAGKIIVNVNGETTIVDTYFKDGWGDYSETEILVEGNEVKKYKIEIEVQNELKEKEVTILGFLVSK